MPLFPAPNAPQADGLSALFVRMRRGTSASSSDGDGGTVVAWLGLKSAYGSRQTAMQRTKEWAMQQADEVAHAERQMGVEGAYQNERQESETDARWNRVWKQQRWNGTGREGDSLTLPGRRDFEQDRYASNRPSAGQRNPGSFNQGRIFGVPNRFPSASNGDLLVVPSHPFPQYPPFLEPALPWQIENPLGGLRQYERDTSKSLHHHNQFTASPPPLPERRYFNKMPAHVKDIFQEHRHFVNSYNTRPSSPEPFVPRRCHSTTLQATSNTTPSPAYDATASTEIQHSISNTAVLVIETAIDEEAAAGVNTTSDGMLHHTNLSGSSPLPNSTVPLPGLSAVDEDDEEVILYRGRPRRNISSYSNPIPGGGGASGRVSRRPRARNLSGF